MTNARSRTTGDMLRELKSTEQRYVALFARWRDLATTSSMPSAGTATREQFDLIEEVLRQQRGAVDRLHQLWIEYAQANGLHAPQ
jgi:hypothetical protein